MYLVINILKASAEERATWLRHPPQFLFNKQQFTCEEESACSFLISTVCGFGWIFLYTNEDSAPLAAYLNKGNLVKDLYHLAFTSL